MKCPRQNCKNDAVVDPQWGVLPCQMHQDEDAVPLSAKPRFYNRAEQDRIQRGWDTNAKDVLQPYMGNKINKEFFQAYPEQVGNYPGAREELAKL